MTVQFTCKLTYLQCSQVTSVKHSSPNHSTDVIQHTCLQFPNSIYLNNMTHYFNADQERALRFSCVKHAYNTMRNLYLKINMLCIKCSRLHEI